MSFLKRIGSSTSGVTTDLGGVNENGVGPPSPGTAVATPKQQPATIAERSGPVQNVQSQNWVASGGGGGGGGAGNGVSVNEPATVRIIRKTRATL